MTTPEPNNINKTPEGSSSRRSFFTKLWVFLGIVALAELVSVLFNFFKPRKQAMDNRGKFYLARLADGGFLALSRTCTHLGCTVPWVAQKEKFICPCHSSEFDISGEVISPPAPRALDIFEITIENNIVKVNTLKLQLRTI
jgi:cytochrome b6-f complex iron-sulfur subunit